MIVKYKMPFPLTVSREWAELKDLYKNEVKKITQKAKYILVSDRGYLGDLVLDIIDENDCTINPNRMGIQNSYMKIYQMWKEGKLTQIT